MPLQDITITGSIGSIATQSYGQRTYISSTDDQSFPIEHITGSDAKAWPNFIPGTNYTVDLVVNVTQSWSESIVTPLGIVPYIHNTMEEFIDGEFSGSNYVVSDGSLNDAQCEQFLTVGTTTISYSMFPYATSYTDGIVNGSTSSLDTFLNKNTLPYNGQFLMHYNVDLNTEVFPNIETYTIDYIKVARFDQEGNDNTLSLQELTHFIWTDSEVTVGEIVLTVENITEYPTYYLYKVNSKEWYDIPYYADDNVFNYAFSASSADPSASAGLYYISNWNVINNASGQIGGAFYQFANTPNCNITYSASITATNYNAVPISFSFGFWSTSDFNYFTPVKTSSLITIPAGNNQTVALNGIASYQFLGETSYWLETKNLNAPISLSNVFWTMTQSQSPQTATSSVVIEPYLLSTFRNSDCDVLMNNANGNDISQTHQRVLYEDGGTIPSNLQQIINGTAEQAEINDYLYNASANTRPRYEGVRTTSNNYNLPYSIGFTSTELSDIELNDVAISNNASNLANVEQLQTYLAYFDYIQDTTAELIDKSAAHILYLIDKDGVIQTPTLTGSYYSNLIDNFETNKNANIIIEAENGDKLFIGNKRVIRPGTIPRAILYTQTGSGFNIQDGITFGDSGSAVASDPINYLSRYSTTVPNQLLDFNSQIILNLDYTTLASPYIQLNAGNNWIEVISGSNNVKISFALYADFELSNPTTVPNYSSYNLNLFLEKSTDGGSSWSTAAYTPFNSRTYVQGQSNTNKSNNWLLQDQFVPVVGDLYRYRFVNPSSYYRLYFKPTTRVLVTQTPPPTSVTASINISDYWTTGSQLDGTPKNLIHSTQLLPLYTPSNPVYQSYAPDHGYAPCLPFVINSGDQIRFEGDELQTYTIGSASITDVIAGETPYSDYNAPGSWSANVNWTINSATSATCTGGPPGVFGANSLQFDQTSYQGFDYTQLYTIYFEVTSYTSGDIDVSIAGGNTSSVGITGTGFYSASGVAEQDQTGLYIISNNFIGTISNIFGVTPSLVLNLDRDITDGTNLNSFLIRRFHPHPNFVVIDNVVLSGSGFLLPEYSTNELRQNFDNIAVSLRERTLI
jgi:hypothetical protein